MTPEQILAGLRDIHLPEGTAEAVTVNLVLWPLIVVLFAALMIAWLIWRRRSVWRRDFFDDLARIEETIKEHCESEGWARLAILMKRLAIRQRGREDVAALNGEPWLRLLDDLVGSDLFTKGPGRGIIVFPYLGGCLDTGCSERMSTDLKATIDTLRGCLSFRGLHPSRATAPSHGMTG